MYLESATTNENQSYQTTIYILLLHITPNGTGIHDTSVITLADGIHEIILVSYKTTYDIEITMPPAHIA
jgi:hypothetical protein